MSIAYTYVIIDNTTGTDVYVGSSRKMDRMYYHERPENSCSSRRIIDRGDYHFEIIKTYNGDISKTNLVKKEQQLMKKMRKVYKMNVVNPQNAYTSEYQKKLKQQRNRNQNKQRKRLYDQQRNQWRYTWGETCNETLTLFNISDDVFQ